VLKTSSVHKLETLSKQISRAIMNEFLRRLSINLLPDETIGAALSLHSDDIETRRSAATPRVAEKLLTRAATSRTAQILTGKQRRVRSWRAKNMPECEANP
jgi:hypothetical protein